MIDKRIKYKDIKGQKHMLAYITPGEAKTLEKLGGQKTITPEGIPAYPPGGGDWSGSMSESGPSSDSGREGGAMANQTQSTPDTTAAPPGDNNFNIHEGPTFQAPPQVPDQIGFSTFGNVPGVDYSAVDPSSQFAINTQLQNQLKDYQPKTVLPGFLNIFKLGTPGNINFFNKNSIGGKINPKTKEPFGYGIDGFNAYMEQRSLGNVGAYGGTELSQNAINASSGGDNGIMDVYNAPNYTDDGDGDADGDGDVDQDDFIFRYFDKTGESLQAGAGGVEDLMAQIRKRISSIFS